LLIEAFSEISKNEKTVNELKTWLLKQKQTNHWRSTRATADACYALLVRGSSWLSSEPLVEITLGNQSAFGSATKPEEGLGYRKKSFERKEINPEMGNIEVSVASAKDQGKPGPSWGAV